MSRGWDVICPDAVDPSYCNNDVIRTAHLTCLHLEAFVTDRYMLRPDLKLLTDLKPVDSICSRLTDFEAG